MKEKFFLKRESLSCRLLYSIFNEYHSVTIGKFESKLQTLRHFQRYPYLHLLFQIHCHHPIHINYLAKRLMAFDILANPQC